MFTSCLNNRLTKFFGNTGTTGEEQAGFREGYNTIDHIFVLHSLVDLYLYKKKRLYCAFIDYKKAFDLVDRVSLWRKLIANNINGKAVTVIYNLYNNAKSCVKKEGRLSCLFNCNIGVRQGENLSPLLFAIFLNDMELHISRHYAGLPSFKENVKDLLSDDEVEVFLNLYVLLYADDTIIMAEKPDELNCALKSVYDYCTIWKLTVNVTKTKIVVFSRGKVRNIPVFKLGDKILEVVDDYDYLGTTFNFNGSFNKAITKQVGQARRALFALLTKSRRLSLPIDIQCELFEKTIMPILLFGCEVWGYCNVSQLEVFYKKFLKTILMLNRTTSSCMVYGEVGKLPLQNMIDKRMLSFWLK